jgi:hypothetical protein
MEENEMGGSCTELRGDVKCLQRLIAKTGSQKTIWKRRRKCDEKKIKIDSKGIRRDDEIKDQPDPHQF